MTATPRNVVLLCLDTVRKDYFDAHASRLRAAADIRFEQCRAASCWSVPSHASMVTGALPHEHGVHARSPRFDVLDPAETVRSDLPDHRFLGVSANVYAGSAYGFDSLFDEFVDVGRDHRYADALDVARFLDDHSAAGGRKYADVVRAALRNDRPGESLLNAAALQLDQSIRGGALSGLPTPFDDGARTVARQIRRRLADADEPVVCFANVMEAHEPHRDSLRYNRHLYADGVPRGWDSTGLDTWDVLDRTPAVETALDRYRSLYGAAVDYLDRVVVDLIDDVRRTTDRETTVVVTADHGENLGRPADDGALGHVTSLSEGVLHVPLLVFNPPEHGVDRSVREYVSHLGLRRLLAGLAAGRVLDITTDHPVAEVGGVTPGNDPLVDADPAYWDRAIRCAYDGGRKVEWDSRGERREVDVDRERPCWQRADGTIGPSDPSESGSNHPEQSEADTTDGPDTATPHWARESFSQPITVVREGRAADDAPGPDVTRRLEDLGYR